MEASNQLKLYSITAAARVLSIGKDAVYGLVATGRIGYIEIGKRKKIPYQELVRFQKENLTRGLQKNQNYNLLPAEINILLSPKILSKPFDAKQFLNSIKRK